MGSGEGRLGSSVVEHVSRGPVLAWQQGQSVTLSACVSTCWLGLLGAAPQYFMLLVFPFTRFVIQLLEDLVFFVSDVPNNGQNVLDIMVTKPNRERQKLMREQNILKQVRVHFSGS